MERRDLTGALFKNDRKEKDTHPDYTGNVTIDGRDYWLSAWIKTGQKGKYMSLALKPKDDRPAQQPQQQNTVARRSLKDDMDDSIPFAPEWRG